MISYRSVALRAVTRNDVPGLFTLLNDPSLFHLWGQRHVQDEQQFYDAWRVLSNERMCSKFVVTRQSIPIGLIFDYERSVEDAHTKVACVLSKASQHRGTGIVAATLFGQWLFQTVPLRRVYLDVYGFNASVISMLRRLDVAQEMQRRDYRYWNGKYWDQFGFAIEPTDLGRISERILRPAVTRQRPPRGSAGQIAASPARSTYIADTHDVALGDLMSAH